MECAVSNLVVYVCAPGAFDFLLPSTDGQMKINVIFNVLGGHYCVITH